MTDPTENEEINEELSTDELKSVSGGMSVDSGASYLEDLAGNFTERVTAQGSGSGMTKDDYRKANRLVSPADGADPGT